MPRPARGTRVSYEQPGFTLLELLVVLALITLVAVLVLPRLGPPSRPAEPELVGFLRDQEAYAASSGRANPVVLAGATLLARDGTARYRLPEGTRLSVEAPAPDAYLEGRPVTVFYPDGTMTAARLRLRSSGVDLEVRLSPFSGIRLHAISSGPGP